MHPVKSNLPDAVSSRVSHALRKAASKKFSAFTLVELIVVITILAILATIGFLALSGYTQDAKDALVKANVRSIYSAIAAESALTGNSPRSYVVHDTGAALSDGALAFVDGSSVTLTGGAYGTANTNYSAGNPDWTKLKLNPEKFRISGSGLPGGTLADLASGFGTAGAAYDAKLVTVGALDVALAQTANGRSRSNSFFQVAGVAPETKIASVVGNFPTPTAAQVTSSGATAGLVKAPTGTGALVDGATTEITVLQIEPFVGILKDINAGAAASSPKSFTSYNGSLYFRAYTPANGWELWKTDGTEAGTVLVKDINTGTVDSNPVGFTVFNGSLYFSAMDAANGREFWKTDGTTAGTVLVKDINTGAVDSYPSGFTAFDGSLYFSAMDAANGTELWKTDGTTAGTVLVKDIETGASGSSPTNLTVFNGSLYFSAMDAANGKELWKTDGTTAGTVLVKDINTGIGNSSPEFFTVFNGSLYFSASNTANGTELWMITP